MSHGAGANYADTVSQDFVKETCPDIFQKLMEILEAASVNVDQLADAASKEIEEQLDRDGVDEETITEIVEAYDALCKGFEDKTGLSLVLGYHDHEDYGDRYDELSNAYWAVDNVWVLSDAGKKNENHIQRCFFVTFG